MEKNGHYYIIIRCILGLYTSHSFFATSCLIGGKYLQHVRLGIAEDLYDNGLKQLSSTLNITPI